MSSEILIIIIMVMIFFICLVAVPLFYDYKIQKLQINDKSNKEPIDIKLKYEALQHSISRILKAKTRKELINEITSEVLRHKHMEYGTKKKVLRLIDIKYNLLKLEEK